jgi:predicted dehydrogenase
LSAQALKTILIGFGEVASGYASDPKIAGVFKEATHIQAIQRHPGFDILAVIDPSEDARRRAQSDWQVEHCYADISQLKTDQNFEFAVLTSPAPTRMAALAQLPDLKAVLAEKPLGQRPGEARLFVQGCADRDLPLQVNYWRRGAPGFRSLADGYLAELVGEPQAVFGLYGNGLYNNASHLVDFVRYLFGEIKSVQATSESSDMLTIRGTHDKKVGFALTLEIGLQAMISPLDFSAYREVGLDIWGRDGRLAIWQEGLSVQHFSRAENRGVTGADEIATDQPRNIECPIDESFYRIYDNIWRHLMHGDLLVSSGQNALQTEQALAALEASAAEGGVVINL